MLKQYDVKITKIMLIIISVLLIVITVLKGYSTFIKTDENSDENIIKESKYKIYEVGQKIKYNPIDNIVCSSGETCYTWYVIETNDTESDSTIDIMMNRIIGEAVAWDENFYDKEGNISENHNGDTWYSNIYGPITALPYFKSLTDEWSNELIRSDTYTKTVCKDFNYETDTCNEISSYTINYSGYKARIITAEEIASIINVSLDKTTFDYPDSHVVNIPEQYNWLLEYQQNTPESFFEEYGYGYWTATADEYCANAWVVYSDSLIGCSTDGGNTPIDYGFGIIPVITIKKEVLN